MLAQIIAAEKFLKCQISMGLADRDTACATQVANLSALIRKMPSISQDECTDLFEYLQVDRNTFSDDARKVLAKLINGRCETGDTVSDDAAQSNPYLHMYYPAWLWDIILSNDTDSNKMLPY